MAWRLLLTRPSQEFAVVAEALAAEGVSSVSLPLLDIEPLAEKPPERHCIMDLDRYPVVIVVSKPAARLLLERIDNYWPQPPLEQHWFCLGSGTGQLLIDYGLIPVEWPDTASDSEALLALPSLQEALGQGRRQVLLVKGEGGRELLADSLRRWGVAVDTLCLYRRVLPEYTSDVLRQTLEDKRLNGLVVTSGQSLESLRRLAADMWPCLERLTLFVPSSRVAHMARSMGLGNVVDCCGAGTPALLRALQKQPAPTAS